ncbi:MAG: GvpL/GvpF family gas vesicle protein, partial [candidate division Zixibacteria bacterium]|nr:GvpL/GvpF family gas vesicle protein [candidate division Zixibacteria bacterium]
TVDYTKIGRDAVARLLITHQKVIERIMDLGYTVLPMRIGTFAEDEAEVIDVLRKGYDLITSTMRKVVDKVEVDIVATWSDLTSIIKEVQEEKEIKEFREQLLANPKAMTVDDQMKAGLMVQKALDKKRECYAIRVRSELKAVSEAVREHDLMDDKMVANCAFLLEKLKQEEFDKTVEELNARFGEKLNFRCVGPLPPYSFYTLDVRRMQYEDLDWAKKRLGLGDFTTSERITKAYRKAAFSSHPDHNPDAPQAERELADATKAYEILTDYGQACEQRDSKDKYSFCKEDFEKNSILITVR